MFNVVIILFKSFLDILYSKVTMYYLTIKILKPITDSAIEIINMLNVCPIPSSKLNELIKTNNVTANSIISIAMIIKIIFFLFKINPNIPIKNKNKERFIVMFMYFVINLGYL